MDTPVKTTIVRDYPGGGQWITVDGLTAYIKYKVEAYSPNSNEPEIGYDEVWFGIDGKVVRIETHDGLRI